MEETKFDEKKHEEVVNQFTDYLLKQHPEVITYTAETVFKRSLQFLKDKAELHSKFADGLQKSVNS